MMNDQTKTQRWLRILGVALAVTLSLGMVAAPSALATDKDYGTAYVKEVEGYWEGVQNGRIILVEPRTGVRNGFVPAEDLIESYRLAGFDVQAIRRHSLVKVVVVDGIAREIIFISEPS